MLKIVHCADIHAGRPAPRELDEEKASVRRREIETSLLRIVELTRKERAKLLLVAGDLFEHLYVRPAWAKEMAVLLGSIPETKVFMAPGNHDPVVKGSLYKSTEWPPNVTVFDTPSIQEVLLDDVPVAVYGFGWASYVERQEMLKGFTAGRPGRFNILMIHGDLPGREGSLYLPIQVPHIEGSGMDYVALGHIHAPAEFRIGRSTVVYPGCPEPLDFGDRGERGAYLVTADLEERTGGPGEVSRILTQFVPLSMREMRSVEVDISALDTPLHVRNALLDMESASLRKRDLWAVTLTGTVDPELDLDLSVLERELRQEFFFLRLIPRYRPAYDLEALSDPRSQSLEARFVRHLQGVMRDAQDQGDDRAAGVAEHALYYGLDALRQGRVLLRKGGSS